MTTAAVQVEAQAEPASTDAEATGPTAEVTPLTVAVALTPTEAPEGRRLPSAAPLAPRECTSGDGVIALTVDGARGGVGFGSSLQGARFRSCPRGSQSLFDVSEGVAGVPIMRGFTPHFRLDW